MTTRLVSKLFGEVFQTERSARRHPPIEAKRLGPCPPASALLAVSAHAARVEPQLNALASARGHRASSIGTAVGSLFSRGRTGFADFFFTTERSYRATLLGMRHGFDLIVVFGAAARAEGDSELAAWCDEWLAERGALIADVAASVTWFGRHPERALKSAKRKTRDGATRHADAL